MSRIEPNIAMVESNQPSVLSKSKETTDSCVLTAEG